MCMFKAQARCEVVYRQVGSDTNGYMRVVLHKPSKLRPSAPWWQGREERLEIQRVGTIFESLTLSLSPHLHTSQSISISILRPASLLYHRTQTFPPPPQYPVRSLSALASIEPSIYPRAALSSYSCPPAAARLPTLFPLLYHVLQAS